MAIMARAQNNTRPILTANARDNWENLTYDVSECMRLHIYAVLYYSNNSIMHNTITSLVCILLVGVL